MDLSRYEGKNVLVQLRNHQEWLVAFAPLAHATSDGDEGEPVPLPAPEIMFVNKGERGEGDPGIPAAFPFINAKVIDAGGTLEVATGNGGVVHLQLSPDVIHSVAVVHRAAQEQRVVAPHRSGLIHPASG